MVTISQAAQLTGVAEHTLRAWERRYGAFQPSRTRGGYRDYGDDALHRMIALYAGRDFAWRVIDSAKAQMDRFRFLSYDIASPMSELIDDHAQIVDAIEAGNAEQAAHITEIHVRQVLQTLPQVARHYPDFFIE